MATRDEYRVTRGGRDVFVGDAEGLAEAAAVGRIRDNDLVFDPSTDTWVFARSHELLTGFNLEALVREYTPAVVDGGVDEGAERRLRRSRLALALAAMALMVGLTGFVAWVAIGGGDLSAFGYFGTQEPTLPASARTKAPKVVQQTNPETAPLALPEELTFDPTAGGGEVSSGDVFVQPDDGQRRAYGAHAMKAAAEIIDDPNAPAGQQRLRDLLGAAARAEFAKLQMQQLSDKPGIEAAKAMLERAHETFTSACQIEHSERYCELKLKYPSWADPIIHQIEQEKVVVGMRSDHVFAAWGRPTRLRRKGQTQRYCYGQFCGKSVRMINRVVIEVDE